MLSINIDLTEKYTIQNPEDNFNFYFKHMRKEE